jgi:hypothetical protein
MLPQVWRVALRQEVRRTDGNALLSPAPRGTAVLEVEIAATMKLPAERTDGPAHFPRTYGGSRRVAFPATGR